MLKAARQDSDAVVGRGIGSHAAPPPIVNKAQAAGRWQGTLFDSVYARADAEWA